VEDCDADFGCPGTILNSRIIVQLKTGKGIPMNHRKVLLKTGLGILMTLGLLMNPSTSLAHCDTMDGPVIKAAQKALETGDVNLVLIWVQKEDERAIRDAFNQTLAVRKLGPEASRLADQYFFETFVRIHRAGEGVAYTGILPAGTPVDPGLVAADRALQSGSPKELLKHVEEATHNGLHKGFTNVMNKKNFKKDDVEAGREYVKAYVEFIHYAERLLQAATPAGAGHDHEAHGEAAGTHKH
jgi:hypothetical protein